MFRQSTPKGVLFAAALLAAACSGPADNKPQAVVTAPVATPATPTAPAASPAPETPKPIVDPATISPFLLNRAETQFGAAPAAASVVEYAFAPESKIEFTGASVSVKNDGEFTSFTGSIILVNNDPASSRVNVKIDMTSVSTKAGQLTTHLKSADFFDVAKIPVSTFESTGIASMADHFMVSGNLALHGITKNVTFPAKIAVKPGEIDADADFAVKRFDFGIEYKGPANNLISDDVAIRLHIVAKPKAM